MAGTSPVLKKPKIEKVAEEEEDEEIKNGGKKEDYDEEEEEEHKEEKKQDDIYLLLEYRTKEVEHIRSRVSYYKDQLLGAERRLEETKSKLARNCSRRCGEGAKQSTNYESGSPSQSSKHFPNNISKSRPLLVIPPAEPKVSQPVKIKESGPRFSSTSGSQPVPSPSHVNGIVKVKEDQSHSKSPEKKFPESRTKERKRKFEPKEHKELIPLICSRSSPSMIRCQTGCISSQHRRKLRSLILCPANDQLFATSALDGVINLWEVQGKGCSSANLLSTTDCLLTKQRRWPEDIAWHPDGSSIFSVYTADDRASQLSILNLNKAKERTRVTFIEEKPHVRGIINNIMFMPWDDTCFATGGSDHAVVLWTRKDGEDSWRPKALHRSIHSSAVMGVAGMQQKKIVLSAGADKRIIGFDLNSGRADYRHQIESKCMSILPNPCDYNLFMVQTGTPERQLHLFDIRMRQTEIHAFGWRQEASDSQSALINQDWSPDGLYITSGSADPVIHIFDIRYNARRPSQSIKVHQKRVFKAVWNYARPLMISISSDLNIGLHKIL